jgi:hypothetical protein
VKILIALLLLFQVCIFTQVQAQENRINIGIVGDGYTQAQIDSGLYDSHVDNILEGFFLEEPFRSLVPWFAVHRVYVASNESGADIPPDGIYVDTAFDAMYWYSGIERALWASSSKAGVAMLDALGYYPDLKLITVNHTKYGGLATSAAIAAGGSDYASELMLHEAGHVFGGLADEYWTDGRTYNGFEPYQKNVTINNDHNTVKWSEYIGEEGVGIYEGGNGYQYGVYRPAYYCKMRLLNHDFCLVCREAIIDRTFAQVDYNPGDANNDGIVDVGDLGILSVNWEDFGIAPDFNRDRVVDVGDLGLLSANWGHMYFSLPLVPVGVPGSGAFGAGVFLLFFVGMRRFGL